MRNYVIFHLIWKELASEGFSEIIYAYRRHNVAFPEGSSLQGRWSAGFCWDAQWGGEVP